MNHIETIAEAEQQGRRFCAEMGIEKPTALVPCWALKAILKQVEETPAEFHIFHRDEVLRVMRWNALAQEYNFIAEFSGPQAGEHARAAIAKAKGKQP